MEILNQLIETAKSYDLTDLCKGLAVIPLAFLYAKARQGFLEDLLYEQEVRLAKEKDKYQRGEQ